jgi:hypothetical protein
MANDLSAHRRGGSFPESSDLTNRRSEAIPREMSSRSARVSANRERRRGAGAMPPVGNNNLRMEGCGRL